jgi:hypothetical protein
MKAGLAREWRQTNRAPGFLSARSWSRRNRLTPLLSPDAAAELRSRKCRPAEPSRRHNQSSGKPRHPALARRRLVAEVMGLPPWARMNDSMILSSLGALRRDRGRAGSALARLIALEDLIVALTVSFYIPNRELQGFPQAHACEPILTQQPSPASEHISMGDLMSRVVAHDVDRWVVFLHQTHHKIRDLAPERFDLHGDIERFIQWNLELFYPSFQAASCSRSSNLCPAVVSAQSVIPRWPRWVRTFQFR